MGEMWFYPLLLEIDCFFEDQLVRGLVGHATNDISINPYLFFFNFDLYKYYNVHKRVVEQTKLL